MFKKILTYGNLLFKTPYRAVQQRLKRFRVSQGIIFLNVFFIVLSASVILLSMGHSSIKNARILSESLIDEIQNSIDNRTRTFFQTAEVLNQDMAFLIREYFKSPVKSEYDQRNIYTYFDEVMRNYHQCKMIYYADDDGNMIMNDRMLDGTVSRYYVTNDGITINNRWEHINTANYGEFPTVSESARTGWDPRTRYWYKSAVAKKEKIWTPVYILDADNVPGFTCSIPIFRTDGSVLGVTSIDITAVDLSRFLGTMEPTPNAKIFIIDDSKQLVAFQAKNDSDLHGFVEEIVDRRGNKSYRLKTVDSFLGPTEVYILNELINTHEHIDEILHDKEDLQTISYNNKTYRAELFPLSTGNGLDLCIIIPESDLLGDAQKSIVSVTLFSIALLILIIIISALLSGAIAKPLQNLSSEMAKIQRFELDSDLSISTPLIEISEMQASFKGMQQGLKNFKHYVPSDLVAQLIDEKVEAKIGGEKRCLTMFFSDIAGFTSISEKTDPDKLVDALCTYFETVSKIILDQKGTIDKYIGDSVMAFWGAPSLIENHAELACRSAVQIQWILHAIFRKWENTGKLPFHTRIGLNTGEVLVGNMGYDERLNYTVIGDHVNLASRLEGANKVYGTNVLASGSTYEQCKNSFEFRHIDRIAVVGRSEGVDIYELHSEKDDISKPMIQVFKQYEIGLQYYFERNWNEAVKCFDSVLKSLPADTPSQMMRSRCVQYSVNPPDDDWLGVYTLSSK
ncbi:MAG: adenylate/guanylate cyclase domain-containing protein [Termitinemataceae bacterium]|nr:MAG: adenylate/guanylate cyclase domain-containing protein [Termitinemataceae bacterium]